jgi:hypothetical protein
MQAGANVRSLDAVRQFRAALVRFEEDAAGAMTSLRQELARTLQWLDHDCPAYWRQELRNCFDRVAEARTHLARRQMMTVAGHRPECIEEKQVLRRAKRDLEAAQQKIQIVRQCSIKTHRAADEYVCRIGRVEQSLAHDVPTMLALIERILNALESYVEAPGPTVDSITNDETLPSFPSSRLGTQPLDAPASSQSVRLHKEETEPPNGGFPGAV